MNSPLLDSETGVIASGTPSSSFELLAPAIQRWIWQHQWQELRDIQEEAIPLLLEGSNDLVMAAPTASGKTEAAFLPLLSRVLTEGLPDQGFALLYVSPLKALINDQFKRLEELCESLEIPVYHWHGDVASSAKQRARRQPRGVLLITPESLEAQFVLRGLEVPRLFSRLNAIVIDELHSLLDSERGVHLRSLLDRIEFVVHRRIRRIGLSATLGNMELVRSCLRPRNPEQVAVLRSATDFQEVKMLLKGYIGRPARSAHDEESPPGPRGVDTHTTAAIARHLFQCLRGQSHLVFAGSRQRVELFADQLRGLSLQESVPNEFFAHYANLSRAHREMVEERLRLGNVPTTAVCTSTLELGIDIGEVESIAQIGPPYTVASLRQRLGRSGRRMGSAAVLRTYIQERALDADSHPLDRIRPGLFQTVAMIQLLLAGWCEPPQPHALHLSTFVHQVLSVIASNNGVSAHSLFESLCKKGPFHAVDSGLFKRILRCLGDPNRHLIEQGTDGTLLLGERGERVVSHFHFYAAFQTPDEFRVVANGKTLGTLPITFMLVQVGMTFIFAGQRWRIINVNDAARTLEVTPDQAGSPPLFGEGGGDLHLQVVQTMRAIYLGEDMPPYLDQTARALLSEGRREFAQLGLEQNSMLPLGQNSTLIISWQDTVTIETLALALRSKGLQARVDHNIGVEVESGMDQVLQALVELAQEPPPSAVALAGYVDELKREKFHRYLNRGLLKIDMASARIRTDDIPILAHTLGMPASRTI